MLGKLIKHEFFATGRYFLPLYGFIVVLTPLLGLATRLMFNRPDEYYEASALLSMSQGVFGALSIGGFVFMMIAIFVATFVLIVMRFYRTMATSEAYLTFTLPVKPWEILFSKTLSAFVWNLASGIIAFFAVLAMVCITGLTTPTELLKGLGDLVMHLSEYEIGSITTFVIAFCAIVIGVFTNISVIYLSIMLGQLFNKNRILISIAMYMGINTALQFLNTFISIPLFVMMGSLGNDGASDITFMNITYLFSCIENIIIGTVGLIVTGIIIKKKLNVQ